MDRRSFFKRLGMAAVGSTVAYSFPSIIVPKNIAVIEAIKHERLPINLITKQEIYPELINDFWFTDSPLFAYLRNTKLNPLEGGSFVEAVEQYV